MGGGWRLAKSPRVFRNTYLSDSFEKHLLSWKNEVPLFHRMAACCQIRISPIKPLLLNRVVIASNSVRHMELLSIEKKSFSEIKKTFGFYLLGVKENNSNIYFPFCIV